MVVAAVLGGAVVTLLARWSPIIRGHGIPEAMEAVLVRQSRVAPRTAIAKPLSAAVAIGTGGPFGAEGPIIVTGGAIGSLLGQVLHVSASERKIMLAAGAAAGMAATFGTPLAAVVLAIELLLFEFSTRALVPLVVATSIAGAIHAATFGAGPLFAVPAAPLRRRHPAAVVRRARHLLRRARHADRPRPVRRRARATAVCRSPRCGTRSSVRRRGRRSGCWCRERSASATT